MSVVGARPVLRRLLTALAILPLLASASAAAAERETLAFPERFVFRIASYSVRGADTELSVLSDTLIGSGFDFTDDLGGENNVDVPRIDGFFRINDRLRFEFGALQIRRDGLNRLEINLDIGDESYSAGDVVVSEIDYELLKLGYAYSFYRSREVELSFTFGLDLTSYSLDYRLVDGSSADSSKASGPLPMFGVRIAYMIEPKWSLHYLSEVLFIETGGVEGSFVNHELDLRYRLDRRLVIGAGLTRFSMDLDSEDAEWRGRIADTHQGFMLFGAFYLN